MREIKWLGQNYQQYDPQTGQPIGGPLTEAQYRADPNLRPFTRVEQRYVQVPNNATLQQQAHAKMCAHIQAQLVNQNNHKILIQQQCLQAAQVGAGYAQMCADILAGINTNINALSALLQKYGCPLSPLILDGGTPAPR